MVSQSSMSAATIIATQFTSFDQSHHEVTQDQIEFARGQQFKVKFRLCAVAHAYNPRIWEADA